MGPSGRPATETRLEGLAMEASCMSRRGVLGLTVGALGAFWSALRPAASAVPEIKLPAEIAEQKPDFETKGLEGWITVNGRWLRGGDARRPRGHEGHCPACDEQ